VVIGVYVGLVTVWGFIWWYLFYPQGPRLSYGALSSFQKCDPAAAAAHQPPYKCEVFADNHPKTISMTVLVIVEMFNALNNISENSSLLSIPPWDNRWLLGAIGVSVALHCIIMYVPGLAALFGITHLSAGEWWYVILLSAPVILVDEVMKVLSRRQMARGRGRYGRTGSAEMLLAPLSAIQVTSPLVSSTGDKSH
jgi:magnesium-transporting ATPase (P-type)